MHANLQRTVEVTDHAEAYRGRRAKDKPGLQESTLSSQSAADSTVKDEGEGKDMSTNHTAGERLENTESHKEIRDQRRPMVKTTSHHMIMSCI